MLLDEFECQESHLVRARACVRACMRAGMCVRICTGVLTEAQGAACNVLLPYCVPRTAVTRASLPAISEKNCLALSRLALSRLARCNMQASLPALRNCEKYWVVQTRLAVSECRPSSQSVPFADALAALAALRLLRPPPMHALTRARERTDVHLHTCARLACTRLHARRAHT